MKKTYALTFVICVGITLSCKKSSTPLSTDNRLIDFKVTNQLLESTIDFDTRQINVVVPYTSSKTKLDYNFSVPKDAVVTLNNVPQQKVSGTADFSKPVTLSILAANGDAKNWTITAKHDVEAYGLGTVVTAGKSVSVGYDWYKDQAQTGLHSSINCGPAVSTMAIKWADQTFSNSVEDARNTYLPTGGWWNTKDVVNYLSKYNIKSAYTTLPDRYETIKKYIDKDYLVILCLDIYYVSYNADVNKHVDKFYKTSAKDAGHFIIVKGYREVDSKFYFEVYDPYSFNNRYLIGNQLKGRDRYYSSEELETATTIWWDYGIIVSPKGKEVVMSANTPNTLVPESAVPLPKSF